MKKDGTGSKRVRGLSQALQRSERVFLRFPTARDIDEFAALRRGSRDFHGPWEPRPASGVDVFSPEYVAEYIRGKKTENRRRLLACSTTTGAILGIINLNEIVYGPLQSASLGYAIGVDYARQGYMTEALPLALRYAFEDLGLHRVEANIRPENVASIALVQRAGFRMEGCSLRFLQVNGCWRDHERWALLRDEWSASAINASG